MNLVVDTSVWSLLLRRKSTETPDAHALLLRQCLERQECIHLIGMILQELLDGTKTARQFDLLVEYLEPFPLIECTREDFIEAARIKNRCRNRGIHAGSVDFLIASVCTRRNFPLLTADRDFEHISRQCDLTLMAPGVF